MNPIAGLFLLCLAWFGGLQAHKFLHLYRRHTCDACRLDQMNASGVAVWIPHTCSRSRGFYRDATGNVIQFRQPLKREVMRGMK